MYGLLISREYIEDVREALDESDVWFERIGSFSTEQFVQHCQAVASSKIQTLIIDATCTDNDSLIKGIRQYRSLRNTRIILLAPGRKPGDPTIATLVGLTVWDIIAPNLEDLTSEDDPEVRASIAPFIKQQLAKEASYGNAMRWDVNTDAVIARHDELQQRTNERKVKGKDKTTADPDILEHIDSLVGDVADPVRREPLQVIDRIIGSVVLSVAGAEPTSGSTHTALLIVNYLARKGYKVAAIEANDKSDFAAIERAYEGVRGYVNPAPRFQIHGVDYYKSGRELDFAQLLENDYDYIVLDMGFYQESDYFEEFPRSHVQIVVGHGIEWRQHAMVQFRKDNQNRDQSRWIYAVPFIDSEVIHDLKKELTTGIIVSVPCHPDPYKAQHDTDRLLDRVLHDYIGKKRKKSKNGLLYGLLGVSIVVIAVLMVLLLKK